MAAQSYKTDKLLLTLSVLALSLVSPVYAQSEGQVIIFEDLDSLLWSFVKTIQFYTLPLMALSLVSLGIRLVGSGDDHHMKSELKSSMLKIIIGGFIVFSATAIAQLLKNTLS